MERAFHGTSHLGRMNVDRLIPYTPPTLRRHLEIYLKAAQNKMQNGLTQATGDMWTRGWEMYKEYSDQIALMDSDVIRSASCTT